MHLLWQLLVFLLTGFCLQAQHETLLGSNRLRGAFGGPIYEYGINGNVSQAAGGGGGFVFDHLFIGAYGVGSIDFDRFFNEGEVEVLDLGHGGIWLGTTMAPHRLVHLYASVRAGWGVLNVDFDDPALDYNDLDKIFVATPELGLELNLTRWCRIVGTAGYRWLRGAEESLGYTDDDFSGWMGGLALRFGWFGSHRCPDCH